LVTVDAREPASTVGILRQLVRYVLSLGELTPPGRVRTYA
jgi:hypothetical protein